MPLPLQCLCLCTSHRQKSKRVLAKAEAVGVGCGCWHANGAHALLRDLDMQVYPCDSHVNAPSDGRRIHLGVSWDMTPPDMAGVGTCHVACECVLSVVSVCYGM